MAEHSEEKQEDVGFSESRRNEDFPFVIDFTNRRITPNRGTDRAVSSKSFLKLRPEFNISGILKADATTTTVDGNDSETTLNSYVVPLNTISRNYAGSGSTGQFFFEAGNVFRIWAAGIYSITGGTPTCSLSLDFNSTAYHIVTSLTANATNRPWWVEWTVIIPTIGSSGTAESFARASFDNTHRDEESTGTQTIDTTIAQTIAITGDWGGGAADTNVLTIRQFLVELMN